MGISRVDTGLKQWQVVGKIKTSSFSVTANDGNGAFSNLAASGVITASLPAAKKGFGPYYFLVATAQTFTVAPKTGDTIRGKAVSTSISASTVGYLLKLVSIIDGFWEVEVNIGPWA